MRPISNATETAQVYCMDHPTLPSRTVARMLFEDHPEQFTSIEDARHRVRYIRGERGEESRGCVESSGLFTPCTKYESEPSDAPKYAPCALEVSGYGCIIADVHIPYHDKDALEVAVNHALKRNATDFLIINGDLGDYYQQSRYEKDPRKRHLAGEIVESHNFLEKMTQLFETVIFKGGNHDKRMHDYILRSAPELVGLKGLSLQEQLELEQLGVQWVSWDDPIYAGEHLTIIHGHEYGRSMSSPVNAARGLFLKSLSCSIVGHYHRSSHHDETDIRGRDISTWSIGCLCDLHPEYARLNKWNHGFMLFETDGADDWNVENHRIIQGRVR